jgi:anti-sigma-K factor RskA
MSTPKDLFDLFRENESLLEQEPSPEVWSRVESRLAARRLHKPRPMLKMPWQIILWVSVVLLLAMLIVVWSLMLRK